MSLLQAALVLVTAGAAHGAVISTTTLSLSTATNTYGSPTTPVYAGINAGALLALGAARPPAGWWDACCSGWLTPCSLRLDRPPQRQ